MDCPQCQRRMRDMEYEGVLVKTCDGCGGEFIGADQLAHIVQTRDERFCERRQQAGSVMRPRFGVPDEEDRRTLFCPDCDTAMEVGNYGGDTAVFVDRCDRCGGVWLDCEELENVQVLMERWLDAAPAQIREIANELEDARRSAAEQTSNVFAGSRFAFVNALINRLLDAA
jgi:Zn-finger nucleic acid-binding protein